MKSRQEKADDLFHRACEHCEEFATRHKCEIQNTCPVYELYKMAKEKKHIIKPDEWQTPPSPKPHYDIANFKPFDKVLVRDNDRGKWRPSIFSYHIKGRQTCYPFCCIGNSFSQCIPFEGNEHLLGTTDMPSEEYINW